MRRSDVFLNFLKDRPGQRFSVEQVAEALTVSSNLFRTDLRKWMDFPEYAHVHRAGEGTGTGRPRLFYWYDPKKVHKPLPPIEKRGPRGKQLKVRGRLPVGVQLVPVKTKRSKETFSVARVLYQGEEGIFLLDDKDQVIRGRVLS